MAGRAENVQNLASWKHQGIEVDHVEYAHPKKKKPKIDLMTALFAIPSSIKDIETKQWPRIPPSKEKVRHGCTWADFGFSSRSRPKFPPSAHREKTTKQQAKHLRVEMPFEFDYEIDVVAQGGYEDMSNSDEEQDLDSDSCPEIQIVRVLRKKKERNDLRKTEKSVCLKTLEHQRKLDREKMATKFSEPRSRRFSREKARKRSKEFPVHMRTSSSVLSPPQLLKSSVLKRRLVNTQSISPKTNLEGYPPPVVGYAPSFNFGPCTAYNPGHLGDGSLGTYPQLQPAQAYVPQQVQAPVQHQLQPSGIVFVTPNNSAAPPQHPIPAWAPLPADPGPTPAGLSFREHLGRIKAHYNKISRKQQEESREVLPNRSALSTRDAHLDPGHSPLSPSGSSPPNRHGFPAQHGKDQSERYCNSEGFKVTTRDELFGAKANQHICILCDSPRSGHYIQEHPARPGKTPRPSICRRCRCRSRKTDRPESLRRTWDLLRENPYMRFWCVRCGTVRSKAYHDDHPVGGRQPVVNACGHCKRKRSEDEGTDFVIAGEEVDLQRRPDDYYDSSRGHEPAKTAESQYETISAYKNLDGHRDKKSFFQDCAPEQPRANTSRPRKTRCRGKKASNVTLALQDDDPFVNPQEISSQLTATSISTRQSIDSIQSGGTLRPDSPLVADTAPQQEPSPATSSYQSPTVESVTDSDMKARQIKLNLQPLLRGHGLVAPIRRERRGEPELHAVTTDTAVPLSRIPPIPRPSLSDISRAAQDSPQAPTTAKSNKSASSSAKTPGSTTCSSGCQSCGCNGSCRKSTTSSTSRTHPRSCFRPRARATTESSSQKTVQWSESQSYNTAPEYDRTPKLPSPEEQLRRWQEITRGRQGPIPPLPLTPEEIARRFASTGSSGQSAWIPPPNGTGSSSGTSEYSASGASPPPFPSAWSPPLETVYRSDQGDRDRWSSSQSGGPARFNASSTTHSSSQWNSNSSSSHDARQPEPMFHETPGTTPATAAFPDVHNGGTFGYATSFEEGRPVGAGNAGLGRAESGSSSRSARSQYRSQGRSTQYDGGASTYAAADYMNFSYPNAQDSPLPNFSYPASSPRNSPRQQHRRHATGASQNSHISGGFVDADIPDAVVWEVDSNEAAEIEGTRSPSRGRAGESKGYGNESHCTFTPSEMSLVRAKTSRQWNESPVPSSMASGLSMPHQDDVQSSLPPLNNLEEGHDLEGRNNPAVASNNSSDVPGYYTASESSSSLNSSRRAHTGHSEEDTA